MTSSALHCHVCLEGHGDEAEGAGGRLVHGGCGCRGSAGFAHLPCMVEAAMHNSASWTMCPTCRQDYTGPAALGLAGARDEHGSTLETKNNLANALKGMGQFAEAWRLLDEAVAGSTAELGPAHSKTLTIKMNLSALLETMGEWAEVQQMFEEGG